MRPSETSSRHGLSDKDGDGRSPAPLAAKKSGRVLWFFTSGKFENPRDEAVMDEVIRYVILNTVLIAGVACLTGFGVTVFLEGHIRRAMADFSVAVLGTASIILMRTRMRFIWAAIVPITAFTILCGILTLSGGVSGFAGLWIYAQPAIAIFVLGMKIGSVLSSLLFIAVAAATFIPGLAGFAYEPAMAFRFCGVYVLVLLLTVVYEWIRLSKDRWGKQLTRELKSERDEMAAMKDNLKTGLFLMNRDLIIQSHYSKAMGDVLSTADLQGKNFAGLLSSSLRATELETLKDYFTMIFDGVLDAKMLEDINPLHEFSYTGIETGEEKTLRCGFAPVDRETGEIFILGTIQDVTGEVKLQKQLEAEESKRQEEMRSLFEIMQVDQKVFKDFIEDTEYEFERINTVLKKTEPSSGEVLVDIYQSVHAIKSNALILGLGKFSEKLHALETKIKNLREQEDVSFEEILHITVELEGIMKEKDKFQETIIKIRAFNAEGESRKGDAEVFVETLSRAGERAASDLGKKVRLEAGEFDSRVLETGPRRLMKEALTQLVRNAVYHGIETPEERKAAGKEETGLILLSIVTEQNTIRITLEDDGRGLDFEKIREKAEALGFLKDREGASKPLAEAGDQGSFPGKQELTRVLFMPGFSTAPDESIHAGRGIGLNLVDERIREAGGTIKLRSEKGRGTAFDIVIPAESKSALSEAG